MLFMGSTEARGEACFPYASLETGEAREARREAREACFPALPAQMGKQGKHVCIVHVLPCFPWSGDFTCFPFTLRKGKHDTPARVG